MGAMDALMRAAGGAMGRGGRAAMDAGRRRMIGPGVDGGLMLGGSLGAIGGLANANEMGMDPMQAMLAGAAGGGMVGGGAGGAMAALAKAARMGGAGAGAMMRQPQVTDLLMEAGMDAAQMAPNQVQALQQILQQRGPDVARQAIAQMMGGAR